MSLDGVNNCRIVVEGADAIVGLYTTPDDNYNGLGWEVELPNRELRYIPLVRVVDNDFNPYKINAFVTIDGVEYQITKNILPPTLNIGGGGFDVGAGSNFRYDMADPVWTRTFVVPRSGYYHFISTANTVLKFGAKSDGWCWCIMATLVDDYPLNATYRVGYKNGILNDSEKIPPRSTSGFTRSDRGDQATYKLRKVSEDVVYLEKGEHTATFWVAAYGSKGDHCYVQINPWNLEVLNAEHIHSFTVSSKSSGAYLQKIVVTTTNGGKFAPDGTYTIYGGDMQTISCDYTADVAITTSATTSDTVAGSLIVNGSSIQNLTLCSKAYDINSVTNVLPTKYNPPSEGSQGEGSGGEGS